MSGAFVAIGVLAALAALIGLAGYSMLRRGWQRLVNGPVRAIYLDRGHGTRVLVSTRYGIRAKPDMIEVAGDGALVEIEKKDRSGTRVYPSDRAQVVASVLAARESGFDVRRAYVEFRGGRRVAVPLKGDDEQLAETISVPLRLAREVARGSEPPANPSPPKCCTCAVRRGCRYSAA